MVPSYHNKRQDSTADKNRNAPTGARLMDRVRQKLRVKHYSHRTERSYVNWIVRFLKFHRREGVWRHPAEMGRPEIEEFLTHLAIDARVAASTQNQAFCAVLFLYRQVLDIELDQIDALRARPLARAGPGPARARSCPGRRCATR